MIAFLHTTSVLLDRFEDLVRKYDPAIEIRHFVQEKLLQTASETGIADIPSFDAAVLKIKELKPSQIICTCSTYGDACDSRTDIARIDQPVVTHLVTTYQKIGVVYTAHSTKEATENLIQNTARKNSKPTEINFIDCTDCWIFFESGDMMTYSKCIATKIKEAATETDALFLAQASMEGAKAFLTGFEKEVFSSPDFGIKKYLEALT